MRTIPRSTSVLSDPPRVAGVAAFRTLAAPSRFRVYRDVEGWPLIPGKLGQIEWAGPGVTWLGVYTDHPRVFAWLLRIPGVRPWQTGDQEMRALFPVEALGPVAQVIQARRHRVLDPEVARQKGAGTAYRATSGVQDRVRGARSA